MGGVLFDSAWLGPLLWAALHVSDYRLTIAGARLYKGQDKIVFEGSYEITPLFQADVNALRRLSPRFVFACLLSTGYLALLRAMASPWWMNFPELYEGVLGALVILELTIHVRHLRNWVLFRYHVMLLQGRLQYPRGVMLRASALELLLFAVLYTALWLATTSLFLLGGAFSCAVLAVNHRLLARRHEAAA